MPRWIPEKIWQGQDIFIIGGGSSLKNFDWNLLKNELTIGCNDAFLLGEDICKVCIFGDSKWFTTFQDRLSGYKGAVFTNAPSLVNSKIPWLWTMGRKSVGLHNDVLGWNFNTGATAVNLAILLGAQKIYLLGFDMQMSKDNEPNWHKNIVNNIRKDKYPKIHDKFLKGFERVSSDLKLKFPDVEVVNVTDNSLLNCFPKIGVKVFWDSRIRIRKVGA